MANNPKTMLAEWALRAHVLSRLGTIVESLAGGCVLATILAGCASPTARDPRDASAAGSSPAKPSAVAGPRFAQGGPDAEDYGATKRYPIGERATCLRVL